MLDDNFFNQMPEDELEATDYLCGNLINFIEEIHESRVAHLTDETYKSFLEFYAVLQAYIMSKQLDFNLYELDDNRQNSLSNVLIDVRDIKKACQDELSMNHVKAMTGKYLSRFNNEFSYEFTDGDLAKVQTLLNEMRQLISDNKDLKAEYKRRILKRLEKLQSELHKSMSDIDNVLGVIMDISIAVGKAGKNVKPMVDRLNEIKGIFWSTQARAEELESGSQNPLLGQDDNKSIEDQSE